MWCHWWDLQGCTVMTRSFFFENPDKGGSTFCLSRSNYVILDRVITSLHYKHMCILNACLSDPIYCWIITFSTWCWCPVWTPWLTVLDTRMHHMISHCMWHHIYFVVSLVHGQSDLNANWVIFGNRLWTFRFNFATFGSSNVVENAG